MTTIKATYENGVLRPTEPLSLQNGEKVEMSIFRQPSPDLSESEVGDRIRNAQSVQEWVEATRLLPPDDHGYDIIKALDANRRWAGERPLLPDSEVDR